MQAEGSSSGSESDRDETWDDFAADGDDQPQPATSLFDGQQFSSAQEALQHDKQVHGVDLPLLAATLGELPDPGSPGLHRLTDLTLGTDFFERIRLINWIRQTVGLLHISAQDRMLMRTRQHPEPSTLRRLDRNAAFLQDDAFLKPVIEDDALLRMLPFPFTASSS